MLKILLLSAAVTTGLAAPSFAQTTQPSTSPSAPATTMPATPPITAPAPGAIKGSTLINMDVKNSADEKIGDINDVIVGADGKVQQVIISVGGFLGVGTRKVAVAWNDVKVDAAADVAFVNMSREQLATVPEFKDRRTTP
ncbi:MAG: PRC-barrel domain-containing protein [Rhodospirillaceae bacterium]|nr:PRC-barrel domain-containing protein [Rhodospirillaceae bacterium]